VLCGDIVRDQSSAGWNGLHLGFLIQFLANLDCQRAMWVFTIVSCGDGKHGTS
jgi:hypothetical protein